MKRRTFLLGSLAAPVVAARPVLAQKPEKMRLGIIGVGGRGEGNWMPLLSEDIRVWCDVGTARVAKAVQRQKADVVQDFRRVLDRKDVDAVVISTPDHWHAIPAVWAMQAGKHVYCEKPLAHSVHECRVMIETARRTKKVTQMGTQIHAGANYRRVVELVQSGAIGKVERVEVWCDRTADVARKKGVGEPVPSTLDYELWLGPAPARPYDSAVVPFNWRWWWDFGGGVLADMACHYMDLPHWALDLRHPTRVSGRGIVDDGSDNKMPQQMKVDYHYPERGGKPAVHLTWYHGTRGPWDEMGRVRDYGFGSGVLFHGEKGQIVADYGRHKLLPEAQFKDFQAPAPSIPDSIGHQHEWIKAIQGEGKTTCNFDYSGALAQTVLLGNVSHRLGKELEWDGASGRITNVSEDEWRPLVERDYRGSWKLKG